MKFEFYNASSIFNPKEHNIRTENFLGSPSNFLPKLGIEESDQLMILNPKRNEFLEFPLKNFEERKLPPDIFVFKRNVSCEKKTTERTTTLISIGKTGKFQKTFSFPPSLTYGHVVCIINKLLYLRKRQHHQFHKYTITLTSIEGISLSLYKYSLSDPLPPLKEIKVFHVRPISKPFKSSVDVNINYTTGFYLLNEKEQDLFTNTFHYEVLLNTSYLSGNSTTIVQLINTFCPYPYAAIFLDTELFGQTEYPCVFSVNAPEAQKYLSQTIGAYAKERLDINLLPSSWYCFCHKNIYKHKTCSSLTTPSSSKLCSCCGLPFKNKNKTKRSFSSITQSEEQKDLVSQEQLSKQSKTCAQ